MEDYTQVITIKITPINQLIQKVDKNPRCWIGLTSITLSTLTPTIYSWAIPIAIAIHLISSRSVIISKRNHLAVQVITIAYKRISVKIVKRQVKKRQHFITIPLQGAVDITCEQVIYNFEGPHYWIDKLVKVENNHIVQEGDSIKIGCDTI